MGSIIRRFNVLDSVYTLHKTEQRKDEGRPRYGVRNVPYPLPVENLPDLDRRGGKAPGGLEPNRAER